MTNTAPESLSPVETEVRRIQSLMERNDFAAALDAAERLGKDVPQNRDVNYMQAVCLRYLQRIPEALEALAHLEKLNPEFSRLYQERGHCYVALKDAPRAIAAYQQAVHRNPALPASWSKLTVLFRMVGDEGNARTAASHVEILKKLPPEVLTATGLFSDGDLTAAEKIIRPYLLKKPDDVEAMRLLARIALEFDVLNDAELLLESLLEIAPDYRAARYDYARALERRHRHARALEQLDILLKDEPDNRVYLTTRATTYVGLGCAAEPGPEALHRPYAEDPRAHRRVHRGISARRGDPPAFWRRVLEPRQPQDLPFHGRGNRGDGGERGCRGHSSR
jgi:tetratricopeptide (TPR) repeat protein